MNAILVLNAGSSSLKFSVFSADTLKATLTGQIEGIGSLPHFKVKEFDEIIVDEYWQSSELNNHDDALKQLLSFLNEHLYQRLIAVGHRVVHGGMDYSKPVLINETVLDKLDSLISLAPLHNPHNIAAIRAVLAQRPDLPQVACFDTAFHRQQDTLAKLFGLPYSYYEQGIQRYGFHGLSYEYIVSALPPELTQQRLIVAHLGSGASLCAIDKGRSVATTMSFTALDGLMMGTRAGNIDAGVLLYLLQQGFSEKQLEELLYKHSGLLGLSGISNDMRVLLESNKPRAKLAVDYFIYRISREVGSLIAALKGLDAIIFTAGIGENSADIREKVIEQLSWLGIIYNASANYQNAQCITDADSYIQVYVLPTNEELMIAKHTQQLLNL